LLEFQIIFNYSFLLSGPISGEIWMKEKKQNVEAIKIAFQFLLLLLNPKFEALRYSQLNY